MVLQAETHANGSSPRLSFNSLKPRNQERDMLSVVRGLGIPLNSPSIRDLRRVIGQKNEALGLYRQAVANRQVDEANTQRERAVALGRTFWDSDQGLDLQARINAQVYSAFRETLPDPTIPIQEVEQIFAHSLRVADRTVGSIVEQIGGPAASTIALSEEARSARTPADFARYLLDETIRPRVRFELWRKLYLGMIAAQIYNEREGDQVHEHRARIEDYLLEEMFFGQAAGDIKRVNLSYLRDRRTGEVVWVQGVHPDSTKEQIQSSGDFIEATFPFDTRAALGGIAPIMNDSREKREETAVLKAVVRARERANSGKPDRIDVRSDVRDHIGKKIVVLGADTPSHPLIELMVNDVKMKLAKRYNLTPEEIAECFVDDQEKNGKTAANHRFRRIQFTPPGAEYPYEIIIEDVLSYLNNELHVGNLKTYNVAFNGHSHEVSLYDGPAHAEYELRRVAEALGGFFPEDIYDPQGEHDLPNMLLDNLSAASTEVAGRLLTRYSSSRRRAGRSN